MKLVGKGIYTNGRGTYAEIVKKRDGSIVVNKLQLVGRTVRNPQELKKFAGFPAAKAWLKSWLDKE